jgi:hypothetical protein
MVRMARKALGLAGLRPRFTDDRWLANEVLFRGRHEFPSDPESLVLEFEGVGRRRRTRRMFVWRRVTGEVDPDRETAGAVF